VLYQESKHAVSFISLHFIHELCVPILSPAVELLTLVTLHLLCITFRVLFLSLLYFLFIDFSINLKGMQICGEPDRFSDLTLYVGLRYLWFLSVEFDSFQPSGV